jgi:hypothetical protein
MKKNKKRIMKKLLLVLVLGVGAWPTEANVKVIDKPELLDTAYRHPVPPVYKPLARPFWDIPMGRIQRDVCLAEAYKALTPEEYDELISELKVKYGKELDSSYFEMCHYIGKYIKNHKHNK